MDALTFGQPDRPYASAAELAYQHIRERLLSGRIPADTPINQIRIAGELGISRVPVRDALQRLQAEGLVTVLPNRRAVATKLTMRELYEVFEMRAVLEGLCARHALAKIVEDDLIELAHLVSAMVRAESPAAYLAKHDAFHGLIAQRSNMPRLRLELARLREITIPYIRILGSGDRAPELRSLPHQVLLDALRAADPAAVESAFRNHVTCAFEEMVEAVDRLGEGAADQLAAATVGRR
jgi:DNA-binding GntR family transcriptional regulator